MWSKQDWCASSWRGATGYFFTGAVYCEVSFMLLPASYFVVLQSTLLLPPVEMRHWPQPHLNYGNAGNQPRCPSSTRLTQPPAKSCCHRSADVRHQDHHSHALESTVWGTASVRSPARVCMWELADPVVTNIRMVRALVSQRCWVYKMPGCAYIYE